MKRVINILTILFLFAVIATSCSKIAPIQPVSDDNGLFLKGGEAGDNTGDVTTGGGITDTDNDEDHDKEGITDTDNDEDHDKDVLID